MKKIPLAFWLLFFLIFGILICEKILPQKNELTEDLPSQEIGQFEVKSFDILPHKYNVGYSLRIIGKFLENEKKYFLTLPLPDFDFGYGDILEVKGKFKGFNPALFDGGFEYEDYAKNNGIFGIFTVKKIIKCDKKKSWFTPFEKIRAFFVERLTSGLTPKSQNWRLILGVTFGNKMFIESDEKELFLYGGIFHLFAVSGLHVAIVAGILLFLLNFVHIAWKIQYSLMPIILFFYVGFSGFSASSMRAWLMITLFCFGKVFFKRVNLYNCLAVAAFLQLIFMPQKLFESGFQLSFLTVFFLCYLFQNQTEIFSVLTWKERLQPFSKQNHFYHILKQVIFQILFFGLVIFLATLGLQCFYFQIVQPFSIFNNFWQGISAVLILFSAIMKAFTNLQIFNYLIDFAINPLILMSEFIKENRFYFLVAKPAMILVVFYYIFLILLPIKKFFNLAVIGIGFIMFLACFSVPEFDEKFYFYHGQNGNSAIVVLQPFNSEAFVFVQGQQAQYKVLQFLQHKNVRFLRFADAKSRGNLVKLLNYFGDEKFSQNRFLFCSKNSENNWEINFAKLPQITINPQDFLPEFFHQIHQ